MVQTRGGYCSTEGTREATAVQPYLPCQERITPAYYVDVRYSGQRWKHWDVYLESTFSSTATSLGVGAELYQTWFARRFVTGLSLVYAQPDDVVGSRLRYGLRFAWCPHRTPRLCAELIHASCGKSTLVPTCDDTDSNRGYNFLTLRVLLGVQKAKASK